MIFRTPVLAYVVIAVGFFLRLAYVTFVSPIKHMLFSDMGNYASISEQILDGKWEASHFFQPIGYPLVLVLLKLMTANWLEWLQWLHLISGTLTLWIFWKTIRESMGEKMGLISLLVASLHLQWIVFTGVALAENLFMLFLSILAWSSLKIVREKKFHHAVLWGTTFFLAFLLKGVHVFLAPLFILGLLYFFRRSSYKLIAVMTIIVATGLMSHGLFTKEKIGKFQMSASAGGLNFVEGKCPLKNNADNNGHSWLSPLYHQLGLTELRRWDHPFTDSGYFMREGVKCIQENPFVLIQSMEGIPFLFVGNLLWPANQTWMRNQMRLYDLFFGCLSLIGLVIYFRFLRTSTNRQEEILVWVLPALTCFLCVYIFKSEIRFRIPFDIWFIPMTVKGWVQLFRARPA